MQEETKEIWKVCALCEAVEVSDAGGVRIIKTGRRLNPYKNRDGGLGVDLRPHGGKNSQVHRMVAATFIPNDKPERTCVDHINHNREDNRVCNLRWCTVAENSYNRTSRNPAGLKGVYKQGQKWGAQIKHHRKSIRLGVFNTKEEAHQTYCEKAKELFGEFACLVCLPCGKKSEE